MGTLPEKYTGYVKKKDVGYCKSVGYTGAKVTVRSNKTKIGCTYHCKNYAEISIGFGETNIRIQLSITQKL